MGYWVPILVSLKFAWFPPGYSLGDSPCNKLRMGRYIWAAVFASEFLTAVRPPYPARLSYHRTLFSPLSRQLLLIIGMEMS